MTIVLVEGNVVISEEVPKVDDRFTMLLAGLALGVTGCLLCTALPIGCFALNLAGGTLLSLLAALNVGGRQLSVSLSLKLLLYSTLLRGLTLGLVASIASVVSAEPLLFVLPTSPVGRP